MKFIIAFWTYIFIGELFGLFWVSSVAFTYTKFLDNVPGGPFGFHVLRH